MVRVSHRNHHSVPVRVGDSGDLAGVADFMSTETDGLRNARFKEHRNQADTLLPVGFQSDPVTFDSAEGRR